MDGYQLRLLMVALLALTSCGKNLSGAPPPPAVPAVVVSEPIGQRDQDQPNLNRPKEALEEFPLESLKIVGHLIQNKIDYALVRAPDHTVHRVKAGNYLGMNFGEIQEVTNTELKVKEIVQDSSGDWSERINKLQYYSNSKGGLDNWQSDAVLENADERNYKEVPVFYATDRKTSGSNEPSKFYGTTHSDVTYGKCIVSIPSNHHMGDLESPSILKFEFSEDPTKHIVLLNIEKQDKKSYFIELTNKIHDSKHKNAFIFIHGYNVTFEDAARRTAQMASDLSFDGAPVFYSWPSAERKLSYIADENSIEWTESHLETFLYDFISKTNANNIYLIAHSMGSRALTKALISVVRKNPEFRDKFKEVILAAPDIDADIFKEQIAPALLTSTKAITLYESSTDTALNFSAIANGGYSRAGNTKSGMVLIKGIDTIDATDVDTSFNEHPLEWFSSVGHSYYGSRSIMEDMFYIIRGNKRPDQRFGLIPVDTSSMRYWKFKKFKM